MSRESIAQALDCGRGSQATADSSTGIKQAESGVTISTALIDQAETNAREAFAALRAAAASKDLREVLQVQADYLREQTSRSMAQPRLISDLIVKIGKDAVIPVKP